MRQNSLARRLWIALWLLLGIGLLIRAGGRPHDDGVIIDHLEFGRRVVHGEELYQPYLETKPLHPPYPPSFGLLTAPFSLLAEAFEETTGRRVARYAWALLQLGALLFIGRFLARQLRNLQPELTAKTHLLLFCTALVTLRYILRDTHGGGGNLINLAMLLGAFELSQHARQVPAGVLLGFSLATKPTGVLLLPLLWLLGHRRAASIAVGAAIGWMSIALLLLQQGLAPLRLWVDGSIAYASMQNLFETPSHGFPPFTWMNQCLRCAVARFCGEVPDELARKVPHFFQGLGLAPIVCTWITRALGALLLGTTFWIAWRRQAKPHRPSAEPRLWMLAAVLCVSLLLSPISWKAHHVALIPALFLLVVQAFRGSRFCLGLLITYVLVCGMGEAIVGKQYKNLQQALYLTTAGTLTIWVCCLRKMAR